MSSAKNSRRIDADLAREKNDAYRNFKILLLGESCFPYRNQIPFVGGSECGKTTIFKQMR